LSGSGAIALVGPGNTLIHYSGSATVPVDVHSDTLQVVDGDGG
jgi:hypothetical protein